MPAGAAKAATCGIEHTLYLVRIAVPLIIDSMCASVSYLDSYEEAQVKAQRAQARSDLGSEEEGATKGRKRRFDLLIVFHSKINYDHIRGVLRCLQIVPFFFCLSCSSFIHTFRNSEP